MAKVRLIGIVKGRLPVTMRHKQSMPPLVTDFMLLQHSAVGEAEEVPLPLLFVRKFMQGFNKLFIIDALHGVVTWA